MFGESKKALDNLERKKFTLDFDFDQLGLELKDGT